MLDKESISNIKYLLPNAVYWHSFQRCEGKMYRLNDLGIHC